MRHVLSVGTAVAFTAALTGCVAASPAPPTVDAPVSSTPESRDPASAAVADYLDAIALGNIDGAWQLLSAETQATYNDSSETYAEYAPTNETVTAAGARALAATTFTVTAGPDDAFQLVSARSGDLADAWVVRDSGSGPRIDDPGIPPTGDRPYTWTNPDATAYDSAAQPTIYFQKTYDNDSELSAGPPETITGYADGVVAAVTRDASSGAGATFVAEVPEGAEALTMVWTPDPDSALWQSSTVMLD